LVELIDVNFARSGWRHHAAYTAAAMLHQPAMFGSRQRLRTIAGHMLLVWVLALLSTVVNACVVLPPGQAVSDAAGAVAHHCHEAAAPDTNLPPAAKSACAKFCDEDASSAPSSQRLASDAGSLGLALWPTLALAVQAALEPLRVTGTGPGGLPPAVPVTIAFLRLTL
jgi:hypothetical protein